MLLIPLITWWTESRTCVSHKYMFPQIALLLNHTNYHPYQPFIKVKGILFTRMTQQPSGGSRGGGQGAQAPPLYFDQNGAQRAGKKYFETAPPLSLGLDDRHVPSPPPSLKDWICHCILWGDQDPGKCIPNTLQTFHFHFTKIRIYSTKCQILCLCYPLSFVFHYRHKHSPIISFILSSGFILACLSGRAEHLWSVWCLCLW